MYSRCGEGGTLQTNTSGVCSQCLSHSGPAPLHGACALPAHTAQALGCSARNHPRLALGCMHFPGPNSSGDQVFGERSQCDLSPPLSLPLSFLGIQPAHLLRRMLTAQNPKKSWLATKPACSLVDNTSLGPRLPSSGSGCPRLPVTGGGWAGLQPASSAQPFIL